MVTNKHRTYVPHPTDYGNPVGVMYTADEEEPNAAHMNGRCREHLWFHVDAMQGGYGPITSLRTLLAFSARA